MNIVGVDIGGTFTDLVGCVDGRIVTSKTSTVPADPTRGVADSLALAHCEMPALAELLHGSTIAINTVLERKGARTALITTRGFRDTYAIGRGNRIEAFNLFFHRPKPLIPRELTFEVTERINAKGAVLKPLDETEVQALAKSLAAQNIEAIAVCFLHAYANPAHERRVGEIFRAANPKLFVTLSHEIVREYREYERTSTTALNAFVGPRVQAYLGRLENHLRDEKFGGKVNIMRSNGGVMSVRLAQEQPVSMMESGPVAGIIGAGRLAALMGIERCIGFDMGGTTAKASLITNGIPAIEDGYVIGGEASGQPMQIPVVDIVEIGAGGGSIAWCDPTGGIHVGPKSAGADPGPAAYGKGSTDPVVTDANLVLGRINAENKIGVGHHRIGRALAIGGWSRIGARALRSDMDAAGRIAPRNRAAARSDLDDVDDRNLHRLAARLAADDVAVFDGRDAVGDQACLRRGAAHVEADAALDAHQRREPARTDNAGDRAGFHHRHRLLLGETHRHHAAVGAHDVDLAAELLVAQVVLQPAQIGLHARADESVERGGRGALVFTIFAHYFVG